MPGSSRRSHRPRLVYQPGGIGALTYSAVVHGGRTEPQELVQALGMQPLALTGAALEREVNAQLAHYQGLAQSMGLTALRPPGS